MVLQHQMSVRDSEALLRKAEDVSSVPEICTIMFYDWKPTVSTHHKSKRIIVLLAVIQHSWGLHLFDKRPLAKLVLIKIPIPQEQVVDTAHQSTTPNDVVVSGPIH